MCKYGQLPQTIKYKLIEKGLVIGQKEPLDYQQFVRT